MSDEFYLIMMIVSAIASLLAVLVLVALFAAWLLGYFQKPLYVKKSVDPPKYHEYRRSSEGPAVPIRTLREDEE